jgi:biopolymer transport protein ExbD
MLCLAPTVDVALALIFFFLLTGAILLQPGIAVTVPDSPFALGPQRNPVVVSITAEPLPSVYFDNHRVTMEELDQRLAERSGVRTVIIKADRRAPVAMLVEVTGIANRRNLSVVLATAERQ